MPITVCSVSSCLSKDIRMFNFPRDKNMQSTWLLYLAPHCPELLQLTSKQLLLKKICIKHFEAQYLNGFKRKYGGLPTLFTEEEISNGIPNRSNVTTYSGDHTYTKVRLENVEDSVPEIAKQLKYSEEHLPDGSISVKGLKISVIYDPPHLMKGLRNNMLNKNLIFEGKLTQWQDIVDVYHYDCELGNIKMLPKLTDEHIIPTKIKKMKVKNCTRVFSERVAATMKYTATFSQRHDGTQISDTTNNTAEAIAFFDRLFDSCNGSRSGRDPGKLRGPVQANSAHEAFWIEAIRKIKNMKFVSRHPLEKVTLKTVPTLKNWVKTLESLIRISQVIRSEGVSFFYTRNLNQDPLENLGRNCFIIRNY